MRAVSVSDLESFEACPRLWVALRVERMDGGSRWTRIGTACHVAADALTRAVLGEDRRELVLVARDAVNRHAAAIDLAPDETSEALAIMDEAAVSRGVWWGVPTGWTARAEMTMGLDDAFGPVAADAAAYRSRLDRLQWSTDELEVWDWKTGQDHVSGDDVRDDPQAQWYGAVALAYFAAAPKVTVRFPMLRLGYTAAAVLIRDDPWHRRIRDRMARLRAAVNRVLESPLEAEERPGKWCNACPRVGACATFARRLAEGFLLFPSMPVEEKARTLLAYRAAVDAMDEQLRAHAAQHGPIPLGNGSALGFWPERRLVLRDATQDPRIRLREIGMVPSVEAAFFAPRPGALPGIVREVIDAIMPSGARDTYRDELLVPSTAFSFEVRKESAL